MGNGGSPNCAGNSVPLPGENVYKLYICAQCFSSAHFDGAWESWKNKLFLFEPPCCRKGGGVTSHSEIIVGDEPPCIFNHSVAEGGRGVTPHSEIIMGDEPTCNFWTTLLHMGSHTPFWNHSGRWITLYLRRPVGFYCNTLPQVILQSLFLFPMK